jgi:hypothetical protein
MSGGGGAKMTRGAQGSARYDDSRAGLAGQLARRLAEDAG